MTEETRELNLQRFAPDGADARPGAQADPACAASGAAETDRAGLGKGVSSSGDQPVPGEPADSATRKGVSEPQRRGESGRPAGTVRDAPEPRAQERLYLTDAPNPDAAAQLRALEPVLTLLSQKYGVDAGDVRALSDALRADDSFFEKEALEKGMTVPQLKEMRRLQAENAAFRRAQQERDRRDGAQRVYRDWLQQGEALRAVYPDFNLFAEVTDPQTGRRFADLLRSGVDVRTTYEVIHKDDVIARAVQSTAQVVTKQVTDDIRARGMRPQENGAGGAGAAQVKTDPKTFTKKDRDEIARRVMRGERIVL